MLQPDFSAAFHVGAHKTATSHLQRSILAHADELAVRGVRYLGPDQLRLPGQSVAALFGLKSGQGRRPADLIAQMRQTAHRLVLSEENYIGVLNSPRRKPVGRRYPDAAARIDAVAKAFGQTLDVFLAIRRPTAFLNSAYCQQLMGGRIMRMAQYRGLSPTASVNWLDMVGGLRAAAGVGQLVVWCYEDYATHFPAICAGMLGASVGPCVTPLDRRIHTSLSAAAVAEVLHRYSPRADMDLGFAARKLLPVEDGFPPFDGFTRAEHAAGDTAYLAQIAAIGAIRGVTLLDPLWAQDAMRA